MKRTPAHFLRFTIVIIGAIVLSGCIFVLPSMWMEGSVKYPMAVMAARLIMLGMYASAIPFYIALWQSLKLLGAVDRNQAFSDSSVTALRNIKRCATAVSALYVGGIPLLYPIADADDAPGLIIVGAVMACAPVAVAVFAAILQRLLQSAIDMKAENDLTV